MTGCSSRLPHGRHDIAGGGSCNGYGREPYPSGDRDRAVLRQVLLDAELAAARRRAVQTGRSMKCAGWPQGPPLHATDMFGCGNDGSTCICECHDMQEVVADGPARD